MLAIRLEPTDILPEEYESENSFDADDLEEGPINDATRLVTGMSIAPHSCTRRLFGDAKGHPGLRRK